MRTSAIRLVVIVVAGLLLLGLAPPAAQRATGRALIAPSANQTRVFQQGNNGYSGASDTWISMAGWGTPPQNTVNYGQHQTLIVSRDGGEKSLLRFDLSSIPTTSAVLSATLSLYNTTPSSLDGNAKFARRIQLFQILKDWDEGNQVASPINAAGKHGPNGDRANLGAYGNTAEASKSAQE